MKCKVRLTKTVELFVEGKDEEAILDWLRQTTPDGAIHAAGGNVMEEYDEEILFEVRDDSVMDYIIEDKESRTRQVSKEVIDGVLENQKGIEKYGEPYELLWYYDEISDKYIGCDNVSGHAWMEEFWTKEECINWLLGYDGDEEEE
jgi:hypothetical protein